MSRQRSKYSIDVDKNNWGARTIIWWISDKGNVELAHVQYEEEEMKKESPGEE